MHVDGLVKSCPDNLKMDTHLKSTLEHLILIAIVEALTNGTSLLLAKSALIESSSNLTFFIAQSSANMTALTKILEDQVSWADLLALFAVILFALFIWMMDVSFEHTRRAISDNQTELQVLQQDQRKMQKDLREMKEMITECVTYVREQNLELTRSDEVVEEDRDSGLPPYTRAANVGSEIPPGLERMWW